MNEIQQCVLQRCEASVLWEVYAFPTFLYCARNEAYTSFYARLQCWPLPISLGPHLCWSGLCARLWMSLWISFSLCDDLPFLLLLQSTWTKLIFFCSGMTVIHYSMTQPACNLFSPFFSEQMLYHAEVVRLCFFFVVVCFKSFSDCYHRSGRHCHTTGAPSARETPKCCERGWVHDINMKYWERHYVVAIIDVFSASAVHVWEASKRVIDYLRYRTATKHLAARPEVTRLVLSYVRIFCQSTNKAAIRTINRAAFV